MTDCVQRPRGIRERSKRQIHRPCADERGRARCLQGWPGRLASIRFPGVIIYAHKCMKPCACTAAYTHRTDPHRGDERRASLPANMAQAAGSGSRGTINKGKRASIPLGTKTLQTSTQGICDAFQAFDAHRTYSTPSSPVAVAAVDTGWNGRISAMGQNDSIPVIKHAGANSASRKNPTERRSSIKQEPVVKRSGGPGAPKGAKLVRSTAKEPLPTFELIACETE